MWGDSPENLGHLLAVEAKDHGVDIVIGRHDHGGPIFGSTENPARMKALSGLANAGLELLEAYLHEGDQVFYVESDLEWEPNTVLHLASMLSFYNIDAVAPMIYAGKAFYDIWGYRGMDKERFGPFPPYHPSLHERPIVQVSSVGSAFMMTADVAQETRITDDNALVGFWDQAAKLGYRVFVDQGAMVRHPA
jgi:hypothetical protein